MYSTDEDMERLLLRYFINDEWASRGSQPLSSIFKTVGRPNGWRGAFFDTLTTPLDLGALSAILERMERDGLLVARFSSDMKEPHYELYYDYEKNIRFKHLFPGSIPNLDVGNVDEVERLNFLELQLAPAAGRMVSFHDNSNLLKQTISEIEKIEQAIRGSNLLDAEFREDVILSLDAWKNLAKNSKNVAVGAFQYLVWDRLKNVAESLIEDAYKYVILGSLVTLGSIILGLL